MSNRRALELLADELNQFAMRVETYAFRSQVAAAARNSPKEAERERLLFDAARHLREQIAELIPR